MVPVLQHVRNKGFTPILWDDMMREWTIDFLKGLLSLFFNSSMITNAESRLLWYNYQRFRLGSHMLMLRAY